MKRPGGDHKTHRVAIGLYKDALLKTVHVITSPLCVADVRRRLLVSCTRQGRTNSNNVVTFFNANSTINHWNFEGVVA